MIRGIIFHLVISVLLTGPAVMATEGGHDDGDISGAWTGMLSLSGPKLRLVFNLTPAAEGGYTATMDSPDQGAKGIPTGSVVFTGDSLYIEVPMLAGRYAGAYDSAAGIFKGGWSQSGFVIPLTLSRDEGVVPTRPQDPQKPYPYKEIEVRFMNTGNEISLAGTLTLPEGDGPFPGVILVSGSGPQDRNEEVLGHRPFLVLADHLTRNGIAVLRYDDRGVGESNGDRGEATSVDFAGDASSAIRYLRQRAEIDPSRTGIIGHSEGAIIATMIASRPDAPAFIVLLGGPGLDGSDILLMQTELICLAAGFGEELTSKVMEQKRLEHSILLSEPNPARAREILIERSNDYFSRYSEEELATIGYEPETVERRAEIYLTPWFRFFMSYDPAPVISLVKCPVLALWGGKDLQVPPVENLDAVRAALESGGNEDHTLKILPGLNHLFQTCTNGSPDEYGMIEETFSPSALEIISRWLREKSGLATE